MKLQSIATFKETRNKSGTYFALFSFLATANICEKHSTHFVDGICSTLGQRNVEKAKSKELYEMLEGFVVGLNVPLNFSIAK
jgi:hypothetical protein